MCCDPRRLTCDEQALIDADRELGVAEWVFPIREVERARRRDGCSLEGAERADVHRAALRDEVDIGRPAEGVWNRVSAMIEGPGAQRMPGHPRSVAGAPKSATAHAERREQ